MCCERLGTTALFIYQQAFQISDGLWVFFCGGVLSCADVCQGVIALRRKKLPCVHVGSAVGSRSSVPSRMCLAAAPRSLARKPPETKASKVATPDASDRHLSVFLHLALPEQHLPLPGNGCGYQSRRGGAEKMRRGRRGRQ